MALDINPQLDLQSFPMGIDESNVDAFLDGVDLYVDGLDFFAVKARRMVFRACAEKGIPATTAAPLGLGVSALNFLPGKMTFEEYFCLEGQPEIEQLLRFLVGLSPVQLQMGALVDDSRLDLEGRKGPSTPMGCELCAGVAASQAMKILLHRGPVLAAPRALHFDAYSNKCKISWRPNGMHNPLQRIALAIGRKSLNERLALAQAKTPPSGDASPIERVLELARWAPSGDNTQPWRFQATAEDACVVHASDTRNWCVYDLEGRASQIAVGAMLETAAIAASGEGKQAQIRLQPDSPESAPRIDVNLQAAEQAASDPLLPFIKTRVTQRRPFTTEPLLPLDKQKLEGSLPEGYKVVWIEGKSARKKMARLLFLNAHIRLTIPEAYQVHSRIIEWNARYSVDRIPDQAVGLDPVALKLMRWAMKSWQRVRFLNRYLAGTWMPRLQLDWNPGLKCAAHFLIVADEKADSVADFLAAGRALQRFWLTSTSLSLQFQPEMTPLIFSQYVENGTAFTQDQKAQQNAKRLREHLQFLVGGEANLSRGVFMGRVGYGPAPVSRSTRLPREQLNLG
jgi:hypothetical protein